ncbi:MAG: endonuclease [Anaerolineae bacterium]|nr:endonuclease [Anaerolineae bacterium]
MPARHEPTVIRVDHRELASGVPERLKQFDWVRLEVEQLEFADYLLSAHLAVERKSAPDFAASILDRRLFTQSRELCYAFERVIYLVEGPDLYGVSRLHPNAIRGALSYLAVLAGVSVLRSESVEDSAILLATMARHAQHGLGYEVPYHAKRRSESPSLQMRYLAENLPGVGPRMAHLLLERFETLEALVTASEDELLKVHGIGPKTAAGIRALLTRRYAPEEEQ